MLDINDVLSERDSSPGAAQESRTAGAEQEDGSTPRGRRDARRTAGATQQRGNALHPCGLDQSAAAPAPEPETTTPATTCPRRPGHLPDRLHHAHGSRTGSREEEREREGGKKDLTQNAPQTAGQHTRRAACETFTPCAALTTAAAPQRRRKTPGAILHFERLQNTRPEKL